MFQNSPSRRKISCLAQRTARKELLSRTGAHTIGLALNQASSAKGAPILRLQDAFLSIRHSLSSGKVFLPQLKRLQQWLSASRKKTQRRGAVSGGVPGEKKKSRPPIIWAGERKEGGVLGR